MEYGATLVKHPSEDNVKNDFFLVGPLVPMRINWLPRKAKAKANKQSN